LTTIPRARARVYLPGILSCFGLNRQSRCLPGSESPGDLDEVGNAVLVEDADGDGRSVATGAVHGNAAIARDLGDAFLKVVERKIHCTIDVLRLPFARIADVKEERGGWGFKFFSGDEDAGALGWPDEIGAVGEGGHTFAEIAEDVIETDASKPNCGFVFATGLGDEDNGFGAIKNGARPGGVLAAESDVDAASEMSFRVLRGIAHVENLGAAIAESENLVEFDGLENFFKLLVEGGAFAGVEDRVVGEIWWRVGLIGGDKANEFVFRHRFQGVIELALLAQSRDRVGRQLLAAERAGAMRGIDEDLVWQGQEPSVKRVIEMAAELIGSPAEGCAKVGAAHVADEEGVAGEHGIRLAFVSGEVEDEDGDGLDGVAGSVEDPETHSGKIECGTVAHGKERIFCFGSRAEMNGCAACIAEFEVAGEKIGVEVREKT
jgi:hypothetical protein